MDDAWDFDQGQCTSWVAYRLNELNGIGFNDHYKRQHWGNGTGWGPAAKAAGYKVDGTPALGAVAWYNGQKHSDVT